MNLDAKRGWIALFCAAIGVGLILVFHVTLPETAAKIMIDRGGLIYPFSVQNGMWIFFFVGLGEIVVRNSATRAERKQLRNGFLPEDGRTILQVDDLAPIYRRIRSDPAHKHCFLPRLLDRCILQFQTSRSTDQSASLMNTSLEMFIHEIDLKYNMLRYICWVIPCLGFIGTVIGIGHALSIAGDPANAQRPDLLNIVTRGLAVSFDGTLVALLLASILVFLQNVTQSKEEHALNQAGQYCLDNLINRLYAGHSGPNP